MKKSPRMDIALLFAFLNTIISFIIEFYAFYPAALGADSDAKGLVNLAVFLIYWTPASAVPAIVMALYATRYRK